MSTSQPAAPTAPSDPVVNKLVTAMSEIATIIENADGRTLREDEVAAMYQLCDAWLVLAKPAAAPTAVAFTQEDVDGLRNAAAVYESGYHDEERAFLRDLAYRIDAALRAPATPPSVSQRCADCSHFPSAHTADHECPKYRRTTAAPTPPSVTGTCEEADCVRVATKVWTRGMGFPSTDRCDEHPPTHATGFKPLRCECGHLRQQHGVIRPAKLGVCVECPCEAFATAAASTGEPSVTNEDVTNAIELFEQRRYSYGDSQNLALRRVLEDYASRQGQK